MLSDLPDEGGVALVPQPSHTIYGGAHLFRSDSASKLARTAATWLQRYASPEGPWSPEVFAALGRLLEQPGAVEDMRVDFEDGYGPRPDEEEDEHCIQVAAALKQGREAGTLPPRVGLRIKALTRRWATRALRTLDLFSRHLEGYPDPLRLTLPKTSHDPQVELLFSTVDGLERRHGLKFEVELMVESPQALPRLGYWVEFDRRVRAVHFGPYDFLAACGVTQGDLHHPLCEAAKTQMLFALAGRPGLEWADGPTTQLPVPPHRGANLSEAQERVNQHAVFAAWKRHQADVRQSRALGFYQSWLLHPAQLVSLQAQLVEELAQSWRGAASRLRHFLDQAGQATRVGEQFDDRATIRLLQLHLQQAFSAGLATAEELHVALGLPWESLQL